MTFAGQVAAVKDVMEKKKVVYLALLKSLAEEKYSGIYEHFLLLSFLGIVNRSDSVFSAMFKDVA